LESCKTLRAITATAEHLSLPAEASGAGNIINISIKTSSGSLAGYPEAISLQYIKRGSRGYEILIYGYDPETKQQSSQWKIPQSRRAKKARQVWSSTKSLLIAFFYEKVIVHREFVPPNTMGNSDFYCDVLRRLRENVRRKRPELWRNHNWLPHHHNAHVHTYLQATEFVTNNNMTIVSHPPYSPDLAPCDLALFSKLKMKLKGRHFETMSGIQRESKAIIDSMKENYFHGALKRGKNDGIAVYVPKQTILKEMVAKIE
jgi:hypothetical protein